jgi:hypothetical protein
MNRRQLLLVLAAVVVASLLVSSGALSSAEADRNIGATTAPDDAAYIGFDSTVAADNGTANLTVTVTNRVPSGEPLTATLSVDGQSVSESLPSGAARDVSFDRVQCGATLRVDADGPSTRVVFARMVEC